MALLRSGFRQRNVSCFAKRDWLKFGAKNQDISSFRAGSLSVLHQHTSKHNTHNLANINNTSPHITLLGPSVRRLLESFGLDRLSIKPSGHKGQLLKGDVLKYINENAKTEIKFPQVLQDEIPKTESITLDSNLGYVDIGLSSTRQAIARQLVEYKKITPHTYGTIDCDVNNLVALCEKLQDHSISVNDFVIKAAALALRLVPGVNSSWSDSGPIQFNDINIAIAIDSPNGLITPVINNADQLDVVSISEIVLELKEKAKSGIIRPDKLQNALFTISDLGSLGVKSFTAIIYPRQSAILAVGQCQNIVNDQNKLSGVMNLTLCCDGRVVDELLASKWLTVFKELIENPLQMAL